MSSQRAKGATGGARDDPIITRELDVPRERVFRPLTDPSIAARVWGPEGSIKHVFEPDPRPGGAIRIHDGNPPDTVMAKATGTIREFVAPSRFAFRSANTFEDGTPPFEALPSVDLLAPGPGRSRVTIRLKVLALGAFPGSIDELEEGFQGGWGQTLDLLQRDASKA